MKHLSYQEYLEFIGLKNSEKKIAGLQELQGRFNNCSKRIRGIQNSKLIKNGFLKQGTRYEKFVKLVSKFISLHYGRKRINDLFQYKR